MLNYQEYRHYLQQLVWQEDFNQLPKLQQRWLTITGSLTAALKQQCERFTVTPIFEGWIKDNSHPYAEKYFSEAEYWLREVILSGDEQPWIFARTVIPSSTFQSYATEIQQLGKQPIGEWLFQQPITRSQLMWQTGKLGFARRSTLMLAECPFFISELFLDDFWRKA
ncbi:chorismate--pyruvate lyase family protein [Gallibacterium sp. AGMB14963]|uniref:chorismate--pyruvate lyase family protein n=1 Tax=Gallibacterium faecale TaxID=3019086 RepID=UPI0022F1678D|nr:chorismate lyase [Gallibacterium sp. AGMB14963]MDA3979627.1 chorismate lyase [Gallibacterium sp. AGMB14963]